MQPDQTSRRAELANFVKVRRLRLDPRALGLETDGTRRRTPGLRREELGAMAGLSGDWIARLEQGRDIKLSRPAAQRLARALRLDPVESEHLLTLCDEATLRPHVISQLSRSLEQIVQHQGVNPCYVTDDVGNILLWNMASEIVFGSVKEVEAADRNRLRLMFLNAEFRSRIVDWDDQVWRMVAQYRLEHDRRPDAGHDHELIDELRTKSTMFNRIWAEHVVLERTSGRKVVKHPEMGEMTFNHSSFRPFDSPDLTMTIFVPAVDPVSTYRMIGEALERREGGELVCSG